jgi:hypothetical protein
MVTFSFYVIALLFGNLANDIIFRLMRLNSMKASDELEEGDIRQLSHDLDMAYSSFHKSLQ